MADTSPIGSIVQGTAQADTLNGSAGSDLIFGYEGGDTLNGKAGNDLIDGGPGFNLMSGGDGNDVLLAGPDENLMLGGNGADQLVGNNGSDAMLGGAGDDTLFGGKGLDLAIGGAGNDLMDTGEGLGVHFGGAGSDTFRIGNDILNNGQADRVVALDFKAGEDKLDLGSGILGAVTRIEDTTIDLRPLVEAAQKTGFFSNDLPSRLGKLDDVGGAQGDATGALSFFTPNELGFVDAKGVSVFLQGGDRIDVVGVTRDQLLSLLNTPST
ncbi:calcium-binding protein [Azospirillum canadense]|uniref:calcium-binding protein n=1 Tax=Azospirillum canadense TaxID=403962 RepID=UPI0022268980|nr:calcium-binding protein [Azospirillum canadense]MCW2240173.1 Ca2+-binding RTX toxin-like protein [Azospirillum canadense]